MGGLTIVIVTTVLTIITIITVSIMIQYNKLNHDCDADMLFWCHTDWQCMYGTLDPRGEKVGTGDEGVIPMNCYLKGMYGKLSKDDADCGKYAEGEYDRQIDKCTTGHDSENYTDAGICKSDQGSSKWPCSCYDMVSNGKFGSNVFKAGFKGGSAGSFNLQQGVTDCVPGQEQGCMSYLDTVCNMVGSQIAGIKSTDPANGGCTEA
jgi:hypothetical protein